MASIRGAAPPSRNGLSHANKTRNPKMAEDLFWAMLEHFERSAAGVRRREVPSPAAPLQAHGACVGLHDDQAVRQLHGLGEAPAVCGDNYTSPLTTISPHGSHFFSKSASEAPIGDPERGRSQVDAPVGVAVASMG